MELERKCGQCPHYEPYGDRWPGAGFCGVPSRFAQRSVEALIEVGRVRFAPRDCSLPGWMRGARSPIKSSGVTHG
jgi:hypothetical protein